MIAQEERASAGGEWLETHLQHVQTIQELKQHHIHLPNEKGERVPLTHCKRPDNPMKCKGDFPRKSWLTDKAVVLCKGLLDRMGLPSCRRRSKLGSLHDPMNHDWLNGTASVLLSVQQFNSDVQLPYRPPLCSCGENCVEDVDERTMIEATQASQDAQAGYACDYFAKRQPMTFNEIKKML